MVEMVGVAGRLVPAWFGAGSHRFRANEEKTGCLGHAAGEKGVSVLALLSCEQSIGDKRVDDFYHVG